MEDTASSLLGTPLVQPPYIEAQNRLYGMDDRAAYFAALRDLVPEATTLRRYDDLGRLVEERELYPAGTEENAIASEAEFIPRDGTAPKRVGDAARTKLDISGWLKQASTFSYDADGRMLTQSAFRRDETVQVEWRRTLNGFEEHYTGVKAWVEAAYNEMQRNPDASWQVVQRYQLQTSTLSESTVTSFATTAPTAARYDWRGRLLSAATPALGYDAAGVLRGYTVQERSGGTVRWTDTYSYEYSLQDGYLETKVMGTSSQQNRRASETLSSYDGWGRRTSLEERTNLRDFKQTLRSARYFAYDAEGGLISRREGELVEEQGKALQFRQARKEDDKFKNFNPVPHLIEQTEWDALSAGEREYWAGAANTHRYSFANGQLLGSVSEAGRMSVGDRLTGFENSSLGTSTVVVRSGETLRSVAQRIYGDGSLWYVLADANGLTNSDETLAEGQNLQVPQVGTNTNSASTFKPYDPSEQIGPTAPSLPTIAPPPKNSCNPIAQLLMVIVAVVVTIYTAGAAAGAMTSGAVTTAGTATAAGTTVAAGASTMQIGAAVLAGTAGSIGTTAMIGAAAIGGAVGSIASQAVGIATGQQQGFSWRGVAAGALSAGFTAGIGNAVGNVGTAVQSAMNGQGSWLNVAKVAGAHALGGAAANVLSGGSFSWRSVAANAVGSVASAAATNAMFGTVQLPGGTGGILSDTATGLVGGIVSAHTRKAFGVGGVNEGRIALDAFGNALGNALITQGGASSAGNSSLGDPSRIGNGLASLYGPAVDDPFGGYGKAGGLLGVNSLYAPRGGWVLGQDQANVSTEKASGARAQRGVGPLPHPNGHDSVSHSEKSVSTQRDREIFARYMDIQDETNRIAIVDDERTRALRLERAAIRDAGSRERRRARQEQARRSAEIEDVLDHRFRPGRFQEKEVEESGGITLHKHASFEKFTFGPRSATFHEWGDDGGIETFVARVGVGSKLGVNSRALGKV